MLGAFAALAEPKAQAAVVLSNLDASTAGNASLDSGHWMAQAFTTGNDAASYSLVSVNLLFGQGNNPSNTMQVFLYDDAGGMPGSQITNGLLDSGLGQWVNAGTYSATPYSGQPITLSAATTYWLLVKAYNSTGSYAWAYTSSAARRLERLSDHHLGLFHKPGR